MKFLSVFAILCLALSCNQVNSAVVTGPVEIAEKVYNELQELSEKAVYGAFQILSGLIENVVETGVHIEDVAKEQLEKAAKSFNEQIDEAVAEAKGKGLDVTDCVGTSQEQISELPAQILEGVDLCISERVDAAADIINDLVEDVNGTVKDVLTIGDQLRSCEEEGFIKQATCLAKVTVKITAEVASLPLRVTKDVADAKLYVSSILPQLAICNAKSAASLALDANAIVKDVKLCLEEQANSSPSSSESSSPSSPPTSPEA